MTSYFVFCWGLDREGVGVLSIEGSVGGWGVIILFMFYAFFTQTRFSFNIFLLQSQFVGVGCRPSFFFVGVRWDRPNMGRGVQYLEHNLLKEKYETYSRSERKQFFGE